MFESLTFPSDCVFRDCVGFLSPPTRTGVCDQRHGAGHHQRAPQTADATRRKRVEVHRQCERDGGQVLPIQGARVCAHFLRVRICYDWCSTIGIISLSSSLVFASSRTQLLFAFNLTYFFSSIFMHSFDCWLCCSGALYLSPERDASAHQHGQGIAQHDDAHVGTGTRTHSDSFSDVASLSNMATRIAAEYL